MFCNESSNLAPELAALENGEEEEEEEEEEDV